MENTMKNKKKPSLFKKATTLACVAGSMAAMTSTTALASDWGADKVKINGEPADGASGMMGSIIGVLLTITRFVGVALVVYGIYEVVMSFMQNQPEAKTKGIVMALSGAVMIALKSIMKSIGVIDVPAKS